MKVVTVAQMRAIEAASDAAGHTYAAMMERAGRAVAQALQARQDVKKKRVLVLVGPGNNGGDGLVAARYLAQAGAEVACYLTRPRDPQTDENFRRLQELRVFCTGADADPDFRRLRQLASGADVVIDALLGTGAALPLKGTIAQVLETVGEILRGRAAPRPPEWVRVGGIPEPIPETRPLVVAVDGPSGMDFDTGALDPVALPADLTITFAYPKTGHFRFPGAAALGELVVADIGTDPALAADVDLEVVTPEMVRGWLPPRPPDAHKGTFGRALIVAGSANYTGAARLAGAAAVRAGAGLVTVALPASIHSAVAATLSEATYLLLPHELGVLAEPAVEVLAEQAGRYDAMLLGPGLGQEKETVEFLTALLRGRERRAVGFLRTEETTVQPIPLPPLVVDADGLNLLARMDGWPVRLPPASILTPHPGEMARLMGASVADVQADRVGVARQKAREWGHVVVLKGAFTVVAAPDGRTVIEPFANPALATGGTGDVLAGVIVALRAQGLGPFEAAAAGVYLHGLAGELARRRVGPAGVAAGDLVPLIPEAMLVLRGEKNRD
ncbi:MAG: NAD(P)H-hydrate dehydratase [Anaerolineae bacterium]|nr:NAD(P)H-hydrate dehydratase [Anaerolineae bacterium]MDW8067434.1 NAD(P)H-hydrate dehydratase [Anaerolineae bacterium]